MNYSLCKHLKLIFFLFTLCFLSLGCDEPGFQLSAIDPVEIKIPNPKKQKHIKTAKRLSLIHI